MEQVSSTVVAVQQEAPSVRTFYSKHGGLTIVVDPGRYITSDDGRTRMVGFREIQFTRQADGYGRYVASDPSEIAFLEKRSVEKGDVFDGAEYTRRTTPDAIRAKLAMAENARLLTSHNTLLQKVAQLEAQLASEREAKQKPSANK